MAATRRQREERLTGLAGPDAKVKVWQKPSTGFGYRVSCRICQARRGHPDWIETADRAEAVLDAWASHARSHPGVEVQWQMRSPVPASGDL